MVKVCDAANPAEAHLYRAALESHGIEAFIRGEALFAGLPTGAGTNPTVWVARDEDAVRAREVLGQLRPQA